MRWKQKKRKTNDRERDEASREKAARPRKRPRADRGGGEAEDSLSERKRAAKLDDLTDVESFFDAVEQGVDLSVRRRCAAAPDRPQPLTRAPRFCAGAVALHVRAGCGGKRRR